MGQLTHFVRGQRKPAKLPPGVEGYRDKDGALIITKDRVLWGSELVEKQQAKAVKLEWYGTTIKPVKGLSEDLWASWAEEVLEEAERLEVVARAMKTDPRDIIANVLIFLCIVAIMTLVLYGG